MQGAEFQPLRSSYPLGALSRARLEGEIRDFRKRNVLQLFLVLEENFQQGRLLFERTYPHPLSPLQQFVNGETSFTEKVSLLKSITDALYRIVSAKVRMRVFSLQTIFVDRTPNPQQAVLFDVPQFHSLYKLRAGRNDTSGTFLEQLVDILLSFDEGASQIEKDFLRWIGVWMLAIDRERERTTLAANLQQLYYQLDQYSTQSEGQQRSGESNAVQYFTMFQIDIYSDVPPIFFIQSQQRTIEPPKINQFAVNFDCTEEELLIKLRHLRTFEEYTLRLSYDDLHSYFKANFLNIASLFDWLTSWPHQVATVSSSGFFVFATSRNWRQMHQIEHIYSMVEKMPHQKMAFNQLALYRQLFEAKMRPNHPISPELKGLLGDGYQFMRKFAYDLFKSGEFIYAAESFRTALEMQLQQEMPWCDQFVGKGNDEDMLNELVAIHDYRDDRVLNAGKTWDCLFICEYLAIKIERSYEWYRQMLARYSKNKAVLYGVLNFYYQNDYFEISNKQLKRLCDELRSQSRNCPKTVRMLLANIYCFRLGAAQEARGQASMLKNNITAKVIEYVTHSEGSQDQRLRTLLSGRPHIKLTYLEGLHLFRAGQRGRAERKFRECVNENPYFRPAHYGIVDMQTYKLRNGTISLEGWINEIDAIEARFRELNLKLEFLLYKRGMVLQSYQNHLHQEAAVKSFRECLQINPFLVGARLRLREPLTALPQFWRRNYNDIQEVKRCWEKREHNVLPFKN